MAIVGVVLGHWLVTGLVMHPDGLHTTSPLTVLPGAAPVSWVLQTLGLFFFAGGFAATRAGSTTAPTRATGQVFAVRPRRARTVTTATRAGAAGRTCKAVVLFLASWAVALFLGAAAGVSGVTLHTAGKLAVGPLWFLLPYFVLLLLTPALRRLKIPWLFAGVAVAIAAVAALDCMSPAGDGDNGSTIAVLAAALPASIGHLAVVAAWAVPWCLGVAVARGRLAKRRHAVLLAVAGSASLIALVTVGGYPVSAVGVPGAGRSNLDPPSLAAVALAVAQVGIFLLLRSPARRPRRWVTALNRAALPVYLGHQSVLLLAAGASGPLGLPGMIGTPGDDSWLAWRVAWLPVLAVLLAAAVRGGRALHESRTLRR
ncbi:acyltransferase family protein [Actinoplanes oryzae]